MEEREYTPDNLIELPDNAIFVFGSNTEGRHGKGAALIARTKFGAIYGKASGFQGKSYAIITKNLRKGLKSVSLFEIEEQIRKLINYAEEFSSLKFYVTKLGSSLAGYSIDEIKQLFFINGTELPDNIILPKEYEVRDYGK